MFFSLSLPLPGRGRGRSGKCFSSVGSRMQRVTTDSFFRYFSFVFTLRCRVWLAQSMSTDCLNERKKKEKGSARSIPYIIRVQPIRGDHGDWIHQSQASSELANPLSRISQSESGTWTGINMKVKTIKWKEKRVCSPIPCSEHNLCPMFRVAGITRPQHRSWEVGLKHCWSLSL